MVDEDKVLAGRKAVDAYRESHRLLHANGWYKGISEDHTPLLNTMLAELNKQGFKSMQEFIDTSEELNNTELNKTYLREGECNRCGKCCGRCEHFLGDNVCTIYDTRPLRCADYPTNKDFIEGLPKECSYRFIVTGYNSGVYIKWQ